MPVSQSRFRRVLGHLAGGVALVTSIDRGGSPSGLTATAVCSVSLDPPLLLVCIDRGSNTHAAIEASGAYAVNLLAADQEGLAVRFAGDRPDKFRGLTLEEAATGSPVVREAPGFLDCTVVRDVPAGDHTVFVGRVEQARMRDDAAADPLVYHLGRYTSLRTDDG